MPVGGARYDWKQRVSGGGLAAAVAAVLVFGALRKADEASATIRTTGPVPAAAEALGSPRRADADPVPLVPATSDEGPRRVAVVGSEPPSDPLGRAVAEDAGRLAATGKPWTLQILVACRPETAQGLLERAASRSLFVLPAAVDGKRCHRLCWGAYDTREEALRASDLPAAIRAGLGAPAPRRVAEILP